MPTRPLSNVRRWRIICSMPRILTTVARRCFSSARFHRAEPETLLKALQDLARQTEVAQTAASPHGRKYVVIGQIKSPAGKMANVRTIWIIDKGWDVTRLVTA